MSSADGGGAAAGPGERIRPATHGDLAAIAAIQKACPEAVQWPPADYLKYRCTVAEREGGIAGGVAGFLVTRRTAPDEYEILNLAVAPASRRKGMALKLVQEALFDATREPPLQPDAAWFLEVRESNRAARRLYLRAGFREVSRRPGYYDEPSEAAIVMRFDSCYRHGAQGASDGPRRAM